MFCLLIVEYGISVSCCWWCIKLFLLVCNVGIDWVGVKSLVKVIMVIGSLYRNVCYDYLDVLGNGFRMNCVLDFFCWCYCVVGYNRVFKVYIW